MIAQLMNAGLSSSASLNVKKAISSLLISLGHSSTQINNHTTSISVKIDRRTTAKEVKDKETYNIDDFLRYIRRRVQQIDDIEDEELESITIALLKSISTRRMAEISRAECIVATMTSEQFVLKSNIQKIIKAASLPYRERITELRAAAITKMIDLGYPMSVINAWSIYSDLVRTLRQYYYRSNCNEIIDQLPNMSEAYQFPFKYAYSINNARLHEALFPRHFNINQHEQRSVVDKKHIIEEDQLQTTLQQLQKNKLQKRTLSKRTQSTSIIALKKRKKKQQ
ncbi:MAG: hypothetical protein EZS28_020658 [Streblomastix strix]|uniref:Uncharacterized protein n=1 Tax=Streblomastix strix TaxID=222440 RepID=A0A5J4VMZ6_9EUKA|nr:MAG: hypothetical protein EZS28_020658 [Streblomastix strix]